MVSFLEFEKPIAELEARIVELRATAAVGDINIDGEIATLEQRAAKLLTDTYAKLTPWQKTQVARHPDRPHLHGRAWPDTTAGGRRSRTRRSQRPEPHRRHWSRR